LCRDGTPPLRGHRARARIRSTFHGRKQTGTRIRLAKRNLAVHGLEGDTSEANTFYDDVHHFKNLSALILLDELAFCLVHAASQGSQADGIRAATLAGIAPRSSSRS
jgi:hypothetical protein